MIKRGDLITFADVYHRRSFWEWLTNKPKKLRIYRAKFISNTLED